MDKAPERIWTNGLGCYGVKDTGGVEYVRADLYEQVKRDRDDAIKWRDKYKGDCDVLAKWNAEEPSERQAKARVKALDWEQKRDDWFANSPAGQYGVGIIHTAYVATIRNINDGQWDDEVIAHGLGLEDAKAAAQADYERRILSALAEPAGEVEPVAWMHTLHMDGNETAVRLARAEIDRPWGKAGIDYDPSFSVTITPLYPTPPDASAIRGARLPKLSDELYEFYPSMSAQTHEQAVKEYALSALAGAKP